MTAMLAGTSADHDVALEPGVLTEIPSSARVALPPHFCWGLILGRL